MDAGEFGTEQVKKEVDYNDFDEAFQTDIKVKHEPCKINTFSECGRYDDGSGTDFINNKPEYINHLEVCEDLSTNECIMAQVKHENDFDIVCEDIKPKIEIVEEKLCELNRFCEVCINSFISETGSVDSKNNKFECSCQNQNDPLNSQSEDMSVDVKLPSLGLTSDSGLQRLIVQDKTREDECSNKPVSSAARQRGSLTSLKNNKRTASNMSDDFLLSEHMKFHCKTCSKSFARRKYLNAHSKTHTGEKTFHCQICPKSFLTNYRLKVHRKTHTGEKPFNCKFCPKSFVQSKSLNAHEMIHRGEKPFVCKVCSKSFVYLDSLKIHENIHSRERPFICKVCSKSFSHSKYLKIHERIHTEEKPFRCKICSKSLSSKSYLNIHLSMHTGEKPFNCKICSKSFLNKYKLNSHLKVHTGEKPFICKICPASFNGESYLNAHLKIHTEEIKHESPCEGS